MPGWSEDGMDQEFATAIFDGLDDSHLPVGGVYSVGSQVMIPFVCQSYKFLGIFDSICGHENEDKIKEHIHTTSGHTISANGYLIKFSALDSLVASDVDDYAPLKAGHSEKRAIYQKMPERLGQVTYRFMEELPAVDELFFFAAGENARRVDNLDLWYQRVSDSVAVTQLNLQRIHPQDREYWYGYRKADR